MTNQLIAVIDDEPDILELVSLHLKRSNFRVSGFGEAEPFYRFLGKELPDLIILDLMLPDVDGFEICKYLRGQERFSSIPIIMLTAKTEETDKIVGLELGADDYVTKPFSPRELVARIKVILRRTNNSNKAHDLINFENILEIDLNRYEVKVKDKKIDLTTTEFKILRLLSEKPGWVYSRDQLLDYLWGNDKIVVDRTIDVHIKNLREKLGPAGEYIKNIRGVGYKLEL